MRMRIVSRVVLNAIQWDCTDVKRTGMFYGAIYGRKVWKITVPYIVLSLAHFVKEEGPGVGGGGGGDMGSTLLRFQSLEKSTKY